MDWITPPEWGSKPKSPEKIVSMVLPAQNLYFHHTVTGVTSDPSKDTRAVEQLTRDKYIAIPYSGLAHPLGTTLQGRYKNGRPALGAHTAGLNSHGLGLAGIGNYEINRPSAELISAMIEIGRDWVRTGELIPNFGGGPHKNFSPTVCCGRYLIEKIPYIVEQIKFAVPEKPPEGKLVMRSLDFQASVKTDDQGNGYVDVYHGQGSDPIASFCQANGGISQGRYPEYTPLFWTAGNDNSFVRVTIVKTKPNSSFTFNIKMDWA